MHIGVLCFICFSLMGYMTSFHVFIGHLGSHFAESLSGVLLIKSLFCLFSYWYLYKLFTYYTRKSFVRYVYCKCLFLLLGLPFYLFMVSCDGWKFLILMYSNFSNLLYGYCLLFPIKRCLCLPPKHKSILLCYPLKTLLFNVLHLVYSPFENNFCVWCKIGLKVYFSHRNI